MKGALLALLLTAAVAVAQSASDGSVQKPFGGEKIRMDLTVGDYDVVPSAAKQIHVSW